MEFIRAAVGEHLWSLVLAGGEGERTRPFIEGWLGYHKPKQYCVFSGNRSLFQQTVDRADRLASPRRRVMVVARDHDEEVRAQLRGRPPGILLRQPANRGTAAGILLALARIQTVDPDAVVVIYPSDHFVHPESEFLSTLARAVEMVPNRGQRLILLGVEPEGAEPDYGWVLPGRPLGMGSDAVLRDVLAFVEKPSAVESQALMARGALWNSMVLVGSLGTFWSAAARSLPTQTSLFRLYRDFVGTWSEREILERIYRRMPCGDFSKDVLEQVRDILAVLPLEGVLWSDWGRPERIARTLQSIGAEPTFSPEHLEVASQQLTQVS